MQNNITHKANRVLEIILILFLLIAFKVCLLTVIQREQKLQDTKMPQRKTIVQYAKRGVIYDRFGIPLAINKLKYNATIYYAHLKQIPIVKWQQDPVTKKKIKIFPRKDHITALSKLLETELNINADRIEDLIYSKSTLLPHVPFVIKENIDENTYYRLKLMERNWPGLFAEISYDRFYPLDKVGANIIGYLGIINQKEYLKIIGEMQELKEYLENDQCSHLVKENIKKRLKELKEKAYSCQDLVGKSGIESQYERFLRGTHGKKTYTVDTHGNFLKALNIGKNPQDGNTLTLTISSELQEFAEILLAEEERMSAVPNQPWIKGGSIVAMNPCTGEILALASYPRFNPNDFILSSTPHVKKEKNRKVNRWLETQQHIANIWDGKENLQKEIPNSKKRFYEETQNLTWEKFLKYLLPEDHPVTTMLNNYTIKNATTLQEDFKNMLFYTNITDAKKILDFLFPDNNLDSSEREEIANHLMKHDAILPKTRILSCLTPIPNNNDKLLTIDLCSIAVNSFRFSDELLLKVGNISLADYWTFSKAVLKLKENAQLTLVPFFYKHDFYRWKVDHQKEFIKKKREEEKKEKKSFHPYVDYLDEMQKIMFNNFWQENSIFLLATLLNSTFEQYINPNIKIYLDVLKEKVNISKDTLLLLQTMTKKLSFELTCEFLKTVRSFSELDRPLFGKYSSIHVKSVPIEKNLAASFYPKNGFGYSRSYAHKQAAALGSIFKIVTSYAVLKERYEENKEPLSPLTIIDDCASSAKDIIVSYSTQMQPYYRFYKGGRLPKSAQPGIGKIDLSGALEQSSNPYFAILAGDFLSNPKKLLLAAKDFGFGEKTEIDLPGEISGHLPTDLDSCKTSLYSFAIGQHSFTATPIQTAVMLSSLANDGKILRPSIVKKKKNKKIKKEISMPLPVKNKIMRGLKKVIWGEKGSARADIIKKLKHNVALKEQYLKLEGQLVGKTSTAEFKYNPFILPSSTPSTYKNIWFGAISCDKTNKPELVVVVYLQFGTSGKEAAPIATQIIDKYRKIISNNHTQQHQDPMSNQQ